MSSCAPVHGDDISDKRASFFASSETSEAFTSVMDSDNVSVMLISNGTQNRHHMFMTIPAMRRASTTFSVLSITTTVSNPQTKGLGLSPISVSRASDIALGTGWPKFRTHVPAMTR